MLQMLGVFAEFEHATIVDRVTAGLERRVREGKWMSGRSPYGYTRDKETKLLVPDVVKAPIVRRIFYLYAEGKLGTTAIARTLDAEAAPSPRKTGWSPNALQLILANPAYRGFVRWNGETHPGLHDPLVDDDTFEKAQQILRRRGEDASLRRGNPTDYLLSGLVRCHHCGRAYVGTSAHGRNGRYTYYACSTRYKYGPAKCDGDRLPKDRLEAAVLTQLAELYRDGHLINQALADLANATENERPELEEQLASTRAEITRVESKLERYFETFEDGSSPPTYSKTASAATVTASKPSANEKPTSPPSSPHTRTHRPTPPTSAASPTNSKPSSPTRTPNKPKNSSACSSKTSKYTTAAGSSPPTGFRRRFAQHLLRWS